MQDSSAFQFIAIDTIHKSTTNPRQTFEQSKLEELAESIRQHGLIQPITVRHCGRRVSHLENSDMATSPPLTR